MEYLLYNYIFKYSLSIRNLNLTRSPVSSGNLTPGSPSSWKCSLLVLISHLLLLPCAARLGLSLSHGPELQSGPELHRVFSTVSHFYPTHNDCAHHRTTTTRESTYLDPTIPGKIGLFPSEREIDISAVSKWVTRKQLPRPPLIQKQSAPRHWNVST